MSEMLYRSRPAAGDAAANSSSPQREPDHGGSQTQRPASQAPFRLQPRSDVHGPADGAGGGGPGPGGGGGCAEISLVSAGTIVCFATNS
eukprot:SAG22_NODE_162_length_16848_cov_16.978267_4_plen_89_part_00